MEQMPPDELARHLALEDLEAERNRKEEAKQRALSRALTVSKGKGRR